MVANIVEATKGKIRDQPIAPELAAVLMGAAEAAGIDTVLVTSGGQPGSTGRSVGSTRHNHGRAADLELQIGRHSLDFTDGGDRPIVEEFVAAAAAHGAIGIGAGVDYMGPKTLHIGFGTSPQDHTKVVWGAEGRSANAPTWLRQAANRGWNNPQLFQGKKHHVEPSEEQPTDIADALWPMLLQSLLTGKRLDIRELLALLLIGKPLIAPAPIPVPAPIPAPGPRPQSQIDLVALLLPLLYERLTGKPWPGTTPAELQAKSDPPNTPAQPATSRPSVQLSAAGLGVTSILQALGIIGTPFGMGQSPTEIGTLSTLIPVVTGVFGATGGFGGLLNAGRMLLGGLAGAVGKPK
jgi:hypothetical protein